MAKFEWSESKLEAIDIVCLKELLEVCFPSPPRNAFETIMGLVRSDVGLYVLSAGNRVAGFAMVVRGTKIGIIEGLCIHPSLRGLGYASRLLDNVSEMTGLALILTTRSTGFYEKRGFAQVSRLSDDSFLMLKMQE